MLVQDPLTGRAINPRLLYAIEVEKAVLVPRIYTSVVNFVAGTAAGNRQPSALNERVPEDTIIRSVEFTIRDQLTFAGNPFKPFFDVNRMSDTFMEVEAESVGQPASECVKVTVDGPMPLEHFARAPTNNSSCFRNAFGEDFVLGKDMQLRIVTTTLAAIVNATQVVYTFKVDQIDGCCLRTISRNDALAYFQEKCGLLRK